MSAREGLLYAFFCGALPSPEVSTIGTLPPARTAPPLPHPVEEVAFRPPRRQKNGPKRDFFESQGQAAENCAHADALAVANETQRGRPPPDVKRSVPPYRYDASLSRQRLSVGSTAPSSDALSSTVQPMASAMRGAQSSIMSSIVVS